MNPSDPAEFLRALQDLRICFEIVTERVAKAAHLNARDLSVLDVLNAQGAATPRSIASRTGIHPATLTAVLARLEKEGRVVRVPDSQDGRSSLISIADDTVTELTGLYADVNDTLLQRFAALPTTHRTVIVKFLANLTTTMHTD